MDSGKGDAGNGGSGGHALNADVILHIDGASTTPPQHLQGFLAGDGDLGKSQEAIALVKALRPNAYRLSAQSTYQFAKSLSNEMRTELVLSDPFFQVYPSPVVLAPACDPKTSKSCFATFDALKTAWSQTLESVMSAAKNASIAPDYYDLMNEPGSNFQVTSVDQILDLLKVAHDIVRKHVPNAKIVAPSVSPYPNGGFEPLLNALVAAQIHVDALSWHELDSPDDLVNHVTDTRIAMVHVAANHPDLAPTEIQVNEYTGGEHHLIPGFTAAYLAALETARVDWATRACWYPTGTNQVGECERGLDGLFLSDAKSPRAVYWVHRAYADMQGARFVTDTSRPEVSLLASAESSGEIRLLLGRHGCGNDGAWCQFKGYQVPSTPAAPESVAIVLAHAPFKTPSVAATLRRIPNTNITGAVQESELETTMETLMMDGDTLTLNIPALSDGDAYEITLH
jgi:hypothetical protein